LGSVPGSETLEPLTVNALYEDVEEKQKEQPAFIATIYLQISMAVKNKIASSISIRPLNILPPGLKILGIKVGNDPPA
jgi:hypothetical protein